MNNKNAGVSIVEMVVILAILAVITGVGAYGVGQVSGYRPRECANQVSTSLSECKVTTLGKAKSTGDIYWELYKEDKDFFVATVYNAGTTQQYEKTEKVGEGNLTVTCEDSAGNVTTVDGGFGSGLQLCFNRASGALCERSGSITTKKKITVSKGNKEYTIELYPTTGKIKGTF